ncbi:hypothetical protein RGQ29_011886 [Quercus rubra]|uniref:Uncharacterized protein n=1 Tax=Quercus rubra TaxID=3512 RepID=A0AAN7G6A4_QUERU|nr:hypothetical protein RGQ29_011886 [Quercus rubra]
MGLTAKSMVPVLAVLLLVYLGVAQEEAPNPNSLGLCSNLCLQDVFGCLIGCFSKGPVFPDIIQCLLSCIQKGNTCLTSCSSIPDTPGRT